MQINLFEETEELVHLYDAMDKIRNKYGDHAVKRASSMDVKSLSRPGNPFDGKSPILLANRRM